MPPKRKSTSDQKMADAKRKKEKRENQTEEQKALDREKDRLRKKAKR